MREYVTVRWVFIVQNSIQTCHALVKMHAYSVCRIGYQQINQQNVKNIIFLVHDERTINMGETKSEWAKSDKLRRLTRTIYIYDINFLSRNLSKAIRFIADFELVLVERGLQAKNGFLQFLNITFIFISKSRC